MEVRLGDSHPVAVPDLIVDAGLQPRLGGVDEAHVAALVEDVEEWPPLTVVLQDQRYLLVDGFHRLAAATQLGLATVQVTVIEWPADADLRSLAFRLNSRHGRPLSLADRKAEALRLLRLAPDRSSRSVGKVCGLNHETVERLRSAAAASGAIRQTAIRVGDRDGGYRYQAPVRKPGELPDESASEWLQGKLVDVISGREAAARRRGFSYLRRVAVALEDQFALPDWQAETLANAATAQLGEEERAALGTRLGAGARNLLQVAELLGYDSEAD